MPDPNNTVDALGTTVEIVNTLSRNGPSGVTELSNRLDIPKSTIFVHLNTLRNHGLVINENDQYRLTYRFVEVGQRMLRGDRLYEHGHQEVRNLAEETGLLANLMVKEGDYGVYLCSISGSESINLQAIAGDRAPLHATGLGQAILAHLPESQVSDIITSRGLEPETPNTITDSDELLDRLSNVRERGFATDDEEYLQGVKCIAVPIHGDSTVAGALSVSGPSSQVERRKSELKNAVIEKANVIELNIVYQ
ncbi:IclR family transcriptional regulator [Natrarchaeobius chitinivorans]|nr:IclR family transcriptional regulator [Natrarchaeobius chitinivorans]